MSATAVPEGMTDSQLEKALQAFGGVVGAEHVLTGDAVEEFRDWFWPKAWTQYDPSAVVQPASAEEVQAIVRLANEHRVPIWTTSQGRNLGLAAALPRVHGSVVVNLRRMNRVLEINENSATRSSSPALAGWTSTRDPRRRPQPDAVLHGCRLGQRRRQLTRARNHPGPIRRGLHGALRTGGRALQR